MIRGTRFASIGSSTRMEETQGKVFLTGVSGLLMQGSGLGKALALGFGEGMFSAVVTGMAWKIDEIN